MATTDVGINVQLLQELRKRYPDIPEHIVTGHMKQHNNDRAKCIETLESEIENCLFGTQLVSSVQDCTIGQMESRQRSDSASSGISSTSSCSISSASSAPYTNQNPTGMHYPVHAESRPQAVATDLTQYVNQNRNIPNIKCDVYSGHNSNARSVTPSMAGSPSKPIGVRQIHVHHVSSNAGQNASFVNKSGQCIEIQISPRNNQQDSPYRQNPSMPTYSPQYRPPNSYATWGKQTPSYNHGNNSNYGVNNNYSNVTSQNYHTSDRYVLQRRPAPPVPSSQSPLASSEGQSPAPSSLQFSSPTKQYINSPTTPQQEKPSIGQQHSSHATIFLRTSSSTSHVDRDRTPYSPSDFMHGSKSDPYLPTSGYGISPSSPQQPNPEYNSPLFIRLDNSEDNSVHSPHYNPYIPLDSGTPVNATNINSRSYGGQDSSVTANLGGAVNPPSYVGKVYPASDFAGGASHNEGEQMFMHYPSFPNRCSVPGHPPVLVRTSSGDSDHRRGIPSAGNGDERHVTRAHVMFPSGSSPDSNNIGSSSSKGQRLSSGSMQEEAAYTTALLQFQKERMEKLKQDLDAELRKLTKTRSEVNQMEKNMLERRKNRCYNSFPSVEDVSRLREINRRLQADIQVMTREVDMYNNGQTPLGVLDPLEQQNFFKNMNTGQQGSIYTRLPPPQTPPRESPPPIPPRTPIISTTVPPAPPRQPAQDSDGDGEPWNCSACTFLNHPALNKCECCEMPRMNVPPPVTGPPT